MMAKRLTRCSTFSSPMPSCSPTGLTTATPSAPWRQRGRLGRTFHPRETARNRSPSGRGSTGSAISSNASLTNSNSSGGSPHDTIKTHETSSPPSNSPQSAFGSEIMSLRPSSDDHCTSPSCSASRPLMTSPVRISRDAPPCSAQSRQPLRSACARNQADIDLGKPQPRLAGSYSQVASKRKLQPSTDSMSFGLGQGHHRQCGKPVEDCVKPANARYHCSFAFFRPESARDHAQIGARTEDFPVAANPQNRKPIVPFNRLECSLKCIDQDVVDGIHWRPREGQHGNWPFEGKVNWLRQFRWLLVHVMSSSHERLDRHPRHLHAGQIPGPLACMDLHAAIYCSLHRNENFIMMRLYVRCREWFVHA